MKSIDKTMDEFLETITTGSGSYFETPPTQHPKDPAAIVLRKIPKKVKNKRVKGKG